MHDDDDEKNLLSSSLEYEHETFGKAGKKPELGAKK